MKNKGFTLVELLAIITILGLIAIITVPIVSDKIEESKKDLAKVSATSYKDAVNEYILHQKINKNTININGNYTINEEGNLINSNNVIHEISFDGKKPENGFLNFHNNELIRGCIKINNYAVVFRNGNIINTSKETCDNYIEGYEMPELVDSGDGLYEASGEPNRYIYRGTNPNNYINLKENNTNVTYRILSYEPDGTIKVVRDESIGNIAWDPQANRQNTSGGYYCNSSNGCNVWGNQSNTYYNGKTLTELNQDFYFYYYPDNQSMNFSIKYDNNYGSVTANSSLNNYLNDTWINTLDFKDKIETHSFNTGGVFYYNTFNNGYSGGDKGLLKEKQEEQVYTWNGKIALMNITEFVETSLSPTCISVYSNYYYQPNNVTQTGTSSYSPKHSNGQWPCALKNWNYKSAFHQWFLSAHSYNRINVWYVNSSGGFNYGIAGNTYFSVRPAFYLKSSIRLSGLGTSENPYYIIDYK